jgi:hypothetical protein
MSRHLDRLLLDEAGISFKYSPPQEPVDIVRHIQTIHDPYKSSKTLHRARQKTPGWIKLTAEAHGNACAIFKAHVGVFKDIGKVSILIPELMVLPGQVAGWSALQLYGELMTGGPIIDQLNFVDPQMGTAEKAQQKYNSNPVDTLLDEIAEEIATGSPRRTASSIPDTKSELIFSPLVWQGHPPYGTRGALINRRQRSLPDALQRIRQGYNELYPGSNTSEAVAGLVCTRNLEDFTGVWSAAVDRYSDKPILAARMLLESGIFAQG